MHRFARESFLRFGQFFPENILRDGLRSLYRGGFRLSALWFLSIRSALNSFGYFAPEELKLFHHERGEQTASDSGHKTFENVCLVSPGEISIDHIFQKGFARRSWLRGKILDADLL